MKEKRMTALWKPHIWPSLHRLQFVPHSAIPDGTVVWVKISAGRHIVQAALSQGRRHSRKRTLAQDRALTVRIFQLQRRINAAHLRIFGPDPT